MLTIVNKGKAKSVRRDYSFESFLDARAAQSSQSVGFIYGWAIILV
jgi:hypothetical protein